MKILRLQIEGFRSLRDVCWEPGDLNVLVGPNGSGKSNLFHLLEMLARSATGQLGRYVQQEGGMEPLVWDGCADAVRIVFDASPLPPYEDAEKDALTYELKMARLKKMSAYRGESEALENRCQEKRRKGSDAFVLLKRDLRQAMIFDMNRQGIDAAKTAAIPEQETRCFPPNKVHSPSIRLWPGSESRLWRGAFIRRFTPIVTPPYAVPWWPASRTKWTRMVRI